MKTLTYNHINYPFILRMGNYNIIEHDYSKDYLTFETVDGSEFTDLTFTIPAKIDTQYVTSVSYSIDNGKTWVTTENEDNIEKIITISGNNKVLFKSNASSFYYSYGWGYTSCYFSSNQSFNIYGNIMSLFYEDDFNDKLSFKSSSIACCSGLFKEVPIINASNLILPATTLVSSCYSEMFKGCTSLTTAPELPATNLTYGCYSGMFYGCTSLTKAPELPATILTEYCYGSYSRYSGMFYGCTSLSYIKMMAIDISAERCLSLWVQNVSPTGTFVKNSAASWNVTGDSGIPTGWTVETADA